MKFKTIGPIISILSLSGLCLAFSGCTTKDDLIVWKATFPAPDGQNIATAGTVQNGGFGTASIETSVYLAPEGHSDQPTQVIGLSCNGPMRRPYTLDNVANAGGSVDLQVHWVGPTRLVVTYRGEATVDFQAIKF